MSLQGFRMSDFKFKALYSKVNRLINKLNNTTVGTLNNQIEALQNDVTTLKQQVTALQNHRHSYTDTTINDTADGSGIATEENKTTGEIE
jgi:uncharacterized protein YlxW (UPF0749 family)